MKTYEEYLKEALKEREKLEKEQIDSVNKEYTALKDNIKAEYLNNMKSAAHLNDDLIDKAYVQKLISKRQVEESLKNMGLYDSGLNKTEQTAIELMHSNQVSEIKNNTQSKLDSLRIKVREAVNNAEAKRIDAETDIKKENLKAAEAQAKSLFSSSKNTEDEKEKKETEQKKDWSKVVSVIFNDKSDLLQKELYVQEYYMKHGLSNEEKLLVQKSGVDYTRLTQEDDELQEEVDKIEKENEVMTEITDTRKSQLQALCDEFLMSRSEYNKERNLYGIESTYEEYARKTVHSWYASGKITRYEHDYLVSELRI